MSDISTIKSAIYDEVVLAVSSFVSDAHAHVIRESDDEPDSPPMVALNATIRDDDSRTGLHGSRVLDVESSPLDILYGHDKFLDVDVTIADTDGDRADTLYDRISNRFTFDYRVRDPQSLVSGDTPPIHEIDVNDASPIGRDQRVGSALAITIEYTRTFYHSDLTDPPADASTVIQTFDDGDIEIETSESTTDYRETN